MMSLASSNTRHLYDTLIRACSQNPIEMKSAEYELQQEYEHRPGYCMQLFKIITNHLNSMTSNVDVRCMAGVCLKNAIDKYWRKSAQFSLSDEERHALKSCFLDCLNEPELKIARQMSVILGKISRSDVPNQWPDLIPKLMQTLQETSQNTNDTHSLVHNRCLMALHQVIKSLASKRLYNDRKLFEEMTNNLGSLVIQLGFGYVEKSLNEVCDSCKHVYHLDQAILCMKILDKLVLHGFHDCAYSYEATQLLENILNSFSQLINRYKLVSHNQLLTEKYEYLCILYVTILVDYQDTYPLNFVDFMQQSLTLITSICFTQEGKTIVFKKLILNFMNLLKSILVCDKYKPALIKNDNKTIQIQQEKALNIKKSYFTLESLKQMLNFIFNEYLLMTLEELEQWYQDEEEFMNEDGTSADAWKYSFRACVETLFQAFVHEYNQLVVPLVCDLLSNVNGLSAKCIESDIKCDSSKTSTQRLLSLINCMRQNTPSDERVRCILLKDAAYNCASIAAWDLMTKIDFDIWFNHSLLPEIKACDCDDLIKRRILILISNWINIKLGTEYRACVYELICECLQPTQNLVIRLQASQTLKATLDDVKFERDVYLPFLSYHFAYLCQLLKESRECDTKIKVLIVLSFIVERVGLMIRPYSSQLADYLPFLWQQSEEHNMLRCAIVTAFTHLVKSFGAHSVNYHSFLIPIIHYSTSGDTSASVYLLDDGLTLWNTTIQNCTQLTPQLLELFANIKPLLDRDTDIWKLCLDIIDSYVVLGAHELFQYYADFLVQKLCDVLTDSIKVDALLRLMTTIGQIFEIPKLKISLFEPLILKAVHLSLKPDIYPMVMAMCLNMLSKPVLEDCQEFLKIIQKCSTQLNTSPEELLSRLLDSWIEKIDMIVHPERRKQTALALTSLLKYNSNVIYQRFGAILNLNLTVLLDILKDDNGLKYDCLLTSHQAVDEEEEDCEEVDTEHEKRKRRLRLHNPVYSVSLKDYCIQVLRELEAQHGREQFQSLMATVEAVTMQKLNETLIQ